MSRSEQFFHGTRFDIPDTVLPVGKAPHRNYFGDDNPEGKAFATSNERVAWQYADGGVNQSVREPRERVYESEHSTGVRVAPGTEGIVHKVRAFDREGEFELPHKPGFRIRA